MRDVGSVGTVALYLIATRFLKYGVLTHYCSFFSGVYFSARVSKSVEVFLAPLTSFSPVRSAAAGNKQLVSRFQPPLQENEGRH